MTAMGATTEEAKRPDARNGRCACEWSGDKLKVVCFAHLTEVREFDGKTPSDAFRVFCPKHDLHEARYHLDRPMADDSCPRCEYDALRNSFDALTEANARLSELVHGAIRLIDGDCPLTETNCDDWLRRARMQVTP
jgi:hypothetical protein